MSKIPDKDLKDYDVLWDGPGNWQLLSYKKWGRLKLRCKIGENETNTLKYRSELLVRDLLKEIDRLNEIIEINGAVDPDVY